MERVSPACIVVAVADRRDRLPLQSLLESRVRGILVEDALDFYERLTGKIAIEALRPSVLIMSKGFRNHGAAQFMARIVSMVVAAVGLVLMAPLLAALAIADQARLARACASSSRSARGRTDGPSAS